jgi:DNA-binding NarL/FixJ family response regulator
LIQVSRSNNVSEFARKKNINRSTVHRRVSKTLQKLDMSALGEFKNYAIKNDLW